MARECMSSGYTKCGYWGWARYRS